MRIFELEKLPSWESMKYEAIRIGLDGCEVFKLLDDETKTREWNGIGSDAMPKWSRKLLDRIFANALPAACIHDFRFVIGGAKALFYDANSELKRNLFKCLRANKDKYSWFGRQITKAEIVIAVWLCNNYGYAGWRNKEENDND